MRKTKKITQTGYLITGWAVLNHWGGGIGEIEMDETFIKYNELTKTAVINAINDGQFGCESIRSVTMDISIVYDNGSKEYDRTIQITHPQHLLPATR